MNSMYVQSLWQKFTYIDPRSYVVFRIALSLSIILDLVFSRFGSVQFMLSDTGAVPRKMLIEYMGFSLFAASGGALWAYMLLAILFVAALCILVGFKTKTAQIVAYILILSLHWRLETVLGGPDRLQLVVLLWSVFLPLGGYGSVDAFLNQGKLEFKKHVQTFNQQLAVFGILLVSVCMYAIAAFIKRDSPDWYTDFTAIYFVLQTGYHNTPLGELLKNQLLLTQILTVVTLVMEWIIGVMLLVPFGLPVVRTIFSVLVILLNIGFGSMLSVGLFPIMGIALGMFFLPKQAWDVLPRAPRMCEAIIIRVARSCKRWHTKGGSIIKAKYTPFITLFLLFNITIQLLVNIDDITSFELGNTPLEKGIKYYVRTLRIDQQWIMFRRAPRWSAWPEVVVTAEDNSLHDVWRERWQGTDAVTMEAPKKMSDANLLSLRLFLYFDKLAKPEDQGDNIHLFYAHYVCKEWNKKHHGNFAKRVEYYYNYTYLPDTQSVEKKDRSHRWTYDCPDSTRYTPDIWYKYML